MEKPVVVLYMNDPMGKRWLNNLDAARRAEKELGAEIKVVKKTSAEYQNEKDPLPCPSVVVNGRIIVRNDMVSFQALKTAIMSEKEIYGGRYV